MNELDRRRALLTGATANSRSGEGSDRAERFCSAHKLEPPTSVTAHRWLGLRVALLTWRYAGSARRDWLALFLDDETDGTFVCCTRPSSNPHNAAYSITHILVRAGMN